MARFSFVPATGPIVLSSPTSPTPLMLEQECCAFSPFEQFILAPKQKFPSSTPAILISSHFHHDNSEVATELQQAQPQSRHLFRKHNSKSIAFLDNLSQHPDAGKQKHEVTSLDRDKMLELSLISSSRRSPTFPGAVDFPAIESETENGGPSPTIRRIFQGSGTVIDEEDRDMMLMRALDIRRSVTAGILNQVMRGSKLSITVKACIQNSKVIPLMRWLKHNSLTYPQIGKLICMCPGDLELIRRLVEWLKSIYVKGKFLGYVLTKADGILERSQDELEQIVGYLESNGVRREWVGFVVTRCPHVLSFSMDEMRTRVDFYLDMGMNKNDFGTMVFEYPKALGSFSLDEMNIKVEYLKEFGLSHEDTGRLLAFKPQLMGCSIEGRWKPLVKYLYYLGVRRDGMRRILTVKPMIFCVDLETTIAPKVRFLQDIGIHEEAIGGVLVKFPPLLTYSLYKKIRPVIIFLMTKAGVTPRDIGKVIALDPELIGSSIINKLEVNVKYFLSLGISLQSLGEMIADFPTLLRYNLNILRPKYRYLRRTMVRPLQDLIEFPRFFSYSLDNRIIPRHKILVENRINFKLRYMLAGPDDEFYKRVEAAIERRRRFESGVQDSSGWKQEFIEMHASIPIPQAPHHKLTADKSGEEGNHRTTSDCCRAAAKVLNVVVSW
ncbi:hypothetical protein MRB53_017873 [Persea americana]|uniref:Uncharacterized protein n=1 Tax=Persea americana TaxID=3435 RepID=A0ACC2M6F3_PERAE|nr:hypothetical protein MRB53_017873 [Persea americana]